MACARCIRTSAGGSAIQTFTDFSAWRCNNARRIMHRQRNLKELVQYWHEGKSVVPIGEFPFVCVITSTIPGSLFTATTTYVKDSGIEHDKTPSYSSSSNGTAERLNRTLFDMMRPALIKSKLPHLLQKSPFLPVLRALRPPLTVPSSKRL